MILLLQGKPLGLSKENSLLTTSSTCMLSFLVPTELYVNYVICLPFAFLLSRALANGLSQRVVLLLVLCLSRQVEVVFQLCVNICL